MGRSKLADLGRLDARPSRLTIPGVPKQDDFRAELRHRSIVRVCLRMLREREQEDVELGRCFPQDVEDSHRSAMAEGIRKVWGKHRNSGFATATWATLHHDMTLRPGRVLPPKWKPAR